MSVKVIIGFDSMQASGYIFSDLQGAGLPADTQFKIVSATDMEAFAEDADDIANPGPDSWQNEITVEERGYLLTMLDNARKVAAEKEADLTNEARAGAAALRQNFPAATVDYSVVPVSPYSAIATAAKKEQADLVVVGSQNATALGRFFLGSVSQNVVSHSDTSVRISRAHASANLSALKIIVGFDASEDSQKVIDAVARRQWPAGTTVQVVTVAEEKSLGYLLSNLVRLKGNVGEKESGSDIVGATGEMVTNLAAKACEKLQAAGINASPVGLHGEPKQVLMQMADDWNADCIFIGAKGHQARKGHPLGAVASVVATRAHCSVEIVR